MIEYKEYKDALHELKVKAISRTMAWLLIRWKCQKQNLMAPASINNIIEVTPLHQTNPTKDLSWKSELKSPSRKSC
jgi:hypothetical protein